MNFPPSKPDPNKYLKVTKFRFDFVKFGNSLIYLFFGFLAILYISNGLEVVNFIHGIVLLIGVGLGIAGLYYFFTSFQFYEGTKPIPKTEFEIQEDEKEYQKKRLAYLARESQQLQKMPRKNWIDFGIVQKEKNELPAKANENILEDGPLSVGETKNSTARRITTTPYINSDLVQVKTIQSIPDPGASPKRIGYLPNDKFTQKEPWKYAVVKMPQKNSLIKFPRKGRSGRKGITEDIFLAYLNNYFNKCFSVFNDRHIPTKNGRPYEPDFVISTENNNKNIFIDIEIDEPYDGLKRTSTNCVGDNNLRDEFFTERGWIVIRFAEMQIHHEPEKCCSLIAAVIKSIDATFNHELLDSPFPSNVVQWNKLQSEKWASENYREHYLGIDNFAPQANVLTEYEITESEIDTIVEKGISRDQTSIPFDVGILALSNVSSRDDRIQFDPIQHRYFIDGNPDTISVTQLIDKFFPEFDAPYWSRRKAVERVVLEVDDSNEENIISMQNIILKEWDDKRINSAELGKALHLAIENYYNGNSYQDETTEFQYFMSFIKKYPTMVPYRSEWRIFDEDLLVAGTVDMVYEKTDGSLYMFDWKRSEKVVFDDGSIKDDSFQYAFGELGHLGNNSFNKYCLQMNIYRSILEKRYGKKISSMNLLVLHDMYKTYHLIKVPMMDEEVNYILTHALSVK